MSDELVAQVRYTEPMIRDAVRAFVWRRFVVEQKLLWVLAGAMFLVCVWHITQDEWLWAIITGSAALLPPLFVLAGWFAHRNTSIGKLRALPEPEAEFAFDASGFRATSGLGEVRLPWSTVVEVWPRPDFWMMVIAPNQFITLPIENLPNETLDRLRGWLGAKVIER